MIPYVPINFKKWIDDHRELLKPPVGNKVVWENSEFIIMVVGSNVRRDFHVNQAEEFFYQVEGDMTLRVVDDGKVRDIPIREGEIFLLPPNIPHSPQRPTGTVGLVVERRRQPNEFDRFQWYCDACGEKLYEESIHVSNIVTELPPLFARFFGDETKRTCRCGARFPDPKPA